MVSVLKEKAEAWKRMPAMGSMEKMNWNYGGGESQDENDVERIFDYAYETGAKHERLRVVEEAKKGIACVWNHHPSTLEHKGWNAAIIEIKKLLDGLVKEKVKK